MTKIYIVRHCQALGNFTGVFQGSIDLDITDLGQKQLDCLHTRFENVHLDAVYSSPLIRTRLTAYAIRDIREIDFFLEDGLIEINGGDLEGTKMTEIFEKIPDFEDIWKNRPQDFDPENGEPMTVSYERIYNTILKIARDNRGKTVACTSHGCIIRCLLCKIMHDDINKLATVPIPRNTSVSLITVDDDDNINIEYLNDVSHLPAEYITPKKVNNIENNVR